MGETPLSVEKQQHLIIVSMKHQIHALVYSFYSPETTNIMTTPVTQFSAAIVALESSGSTFSSQNTFFVMNRNANSIDQN